MEGHMKHSFLSTRYLPNHQPYQGPIPYELPLALDSLTFIDLSENTLSGTLPDTMGVMSSLVELHLRFNRLVSECKRGFSSICSMSP